MHLGTPSLLAALGRDLSLLPRIFIRLLHCMEYRLAHRRLDWEPLFVGPVRRHAREIDSRNSSRSTRWLTHHLEARPFQEFSGPVLHDMCGSCLPIGDAQHRFRNGQDVGAKAGRGPAGLLEADLSAVVLRSRQPRGPVYTERSSCDADERATEGNTRLPRRNRGCHQASDIGTPYPQTLAVLRDVVDGVDWLHESSKSSRGSSGGGCAWLRRRGGGH